MMHTINFIKITVLALAIQPAFAQSIDEYVIESEKNIMWVNGTRGIMKPVSDLSYYKTVFERAFENMSLTDGKPTVADIAVLEAKTVVIHKSRYHLIRFKWKDSERILEIDTAPISDGTWKGMWSVR